MSNILSLFSKFGDSQISEMNPFGSSTGVSTPVVSKQGKPSMPPMPGNHDANLFDSVASFTESPAGVSFAPLSRSLAGPKKEPGQLTQSASLLSAEQRQKFNDATTDILVISY